MTSLALALSLALVPARNADAVDDALAAVEARVVELRRTIHAHPELGERERETAALVAGHLRALGLEVREQVAVTGVVGVLRGGRPGPVVAYRADMDALPVTEETGLPFASTRTDVWGGKEVGVMHACGHDLHTAIGLGVASVLAAPAVRAELPGTVLFLFQPAEEGMPGQELFGARRMLVDGAFDDPRPSAAFGLHVDPSLALGEVAVVPGGAMAAVDRFTIEIEGRQTHGAYPHKGVDPIVAGSQIVVALQTIASRNVNTLLPVVVTVGRFESGNRYNIVPGHASLEGTIRTYDDEVQAFVHRRVEEIATGVATSLGATARVAIERITPATINDPALVERMRPVFGQPGTGTLVPHDPQMGGEDFAWFAREVPGFYYLLGVSDPADGEPAMIHTPRFDPEEGALAVGVATSVRLLLGYLRG